MKNKKSESILVPLISAYDARRIYDPIPLKTSVGKMTVTRDDAFPKTIRFENIVAFGDEASIESKVYETLTVFLGNTSPAGFVVSVEYDQDHLMPILEGESMSRIIRVCLTASMRSSWSSPSSPAL